MKKEMTLRRTLLLIGVLLAVVVVLGAVLLRSGGAPSAQGGAPESSAPAAESEDVAAVSAAEPEVFDGHEEELAASERGDVSAEQEREEEPVHSVDSGVPSSPMAEEDDPYPGLYAQSGEKTDDNTRKIIYLTFDDGPSDNTERIMKILDDHGVKATFFVTGQYGTEEERAQRYQELLEEGHTIGLHTYSHNYEKIYASVDNFLKDLNKINEEVYAATGYQANLIRFPGGSVNRYNREICEELTEEVERRGYTYHDWAVSCGDAEGKNLSAAEVAKETAEECEGRTKSVVLFHDTPAQDTTVEALDRLIDRLEDEGYEFRPLDNTIRPFQFHIEE